MTSPTSLADESQTKPGAQSANGTAAQQPPQLLECDLVMKGGVTSGVAYPPAVLVLAERFTFRSIAGTSAGAIAAALTAAAEYGRTVCPSSSGTRTGFDGFAVLSQSLASNGFIYRRLQPHALFRSTFRALFRFAGLSRKLRPLFGGSNRGASIVAAAVALSSTLWAQSALGGLIGAALGWPLARELHDVSSILGWVMHLMQILVGCVLGAAVAVALRLRSLASPLTARFGMCTGSAGAGANFERPSELQLTDWLHYWINRLAGRGPHEAALTFAELERDAQINLKLMSANLSLSQAFVLPLERGSRSFFFRRADLAGLFPPSVLRQLEAWAAANPTTKLRLGDDSEFLRFPFGKDLPLVVAARLSLSFPLLLSAVRLHSFKPSAYQRAAAGEAIDSEAVEEHWLSDGGITSNFPLHLFDSWIPRRPTFGITLYDSPIAAVLGQRETTEDVVLPRPIDFDLARPPRFEIGGTVDFMRAVFQAAQSHRDVAQSGLPSYRERVAQIFLSAHEGGLNLGMDRRTIEAIQEKGRIAARKLLERYVDGSALSAGFLEHIWVRTLVLFGQLEKQLLEVTGGSPASDWRLQTMQRYSEMLRAMQNSNPQWYRWRNEQWAVEAERRLASLLDLVESWTASPSRCFSSHPPRPEGHLRVTPET